MLFLISDYQKSSNLPNCFHKS